MPKNMKNVLRNEIKIELRYLIQNECSSKKRKLKKYKNPHCSISQENKKKSVILEHLLAGLVRRGRYDPASFQNVIVMGLEELDSDVYNIDKIWKFLNSVGSKVDYQRYGEFLFDILITGGILVAKEDGNELPKTNSCIFKAPTDNLTYIRNFCKIFKRLVKFYKYLEKIFHEEMKKVLILINTFRQSERTNLSRMTAFWIASNSWNSHVLAVLLNNHLVNDGLSLEFLIEIFVTWKREKCLTERMTTFKIRGLKKGLMDFIPSDKRTKQYFNTVFEEKDLGEILENSSIRLLTGAIRSRLSIRLKNGCPVEQIIFEVQDMMMIASVPEHEIVTVVWMVVMSLVQWNEEKRVLQHWVQYTVLLAAFVTTAESERVLIRQVQSHCYHNKDSINVFHEIIFFFYKAGILSREEILDSCKEMYAKTKKSNIMFLEQIKFLIMLLQNIKEDGYNNPARFQNFIVVGLNSAGSDFDAIWQFLYSAGFKNNFRRHGEALFDILITGGLLVPGGSIGNNLRKMNSCIFRAPDDLTYMRNFGQVFVKLLRRYKYLENILCEEMKKVLILIDGFKQSENINLARMTAYLIANNSVHSQVLSVLLNEHLVKNGIALKFLINVFITWKQEECLTELSTMFETGVLKNGLMIFLPKKRRNVIYLKNVFEEIGLPEIVKLHFSAQKCLLAEQKLECRLSELIAKKCPVEKIVYEVQEMSKKACTPEHEIVILVWRVVMSCGKLENKEQALEYLKRHAVLLAAFTKTTQSEFVLMQSVQHYCCENLAFQNVFPKIIVLFYRTGILSKKMILQWREGAHSNEEMIRKFLKQMKPFIKSLQNAEEEPE